MSDYKNTVKALSEMASDDVLAIAKQITSWDGTFQETELDCYTLDELVDLYVCGDAECMKRLIVMIADSKPDMSCEWFWFDAYGLNSTNEIDTDFYIDDIADWLVDNVGFAGFPDYGITDELAKAVATDAGISVDEL